MSCGGGGWISAKRAETWVVGWVGCIPARIDAKSKWPGRLEMVSHLVDRVLTMQWQSVAKKSCPFEWVGPRVRELCLLHDRTHLEEIKKARDASCPMDAAHDAIISILDDSTTISSKLFSASLHVVTNGKIADTLGKATLWLLDTLPSSGVLDLEHYECCRQVIMKDVMAMPGCFVRLRVCVDVGLVGVGLVGVGLLGVGLESWCGESVVGWLLAPPPPPPPPAAPTSAHHHHQHQHNHHHHRPALSHLKASTVCEHSGRLHFLTGGSTSPVCTSETLLTSSMCERWPL